MKQTYNFEMNKTAKQFLKDTAIYWGLALIISIAGMLMIDVLFPLPVKHTNWTWDGVLMFLTVCAGLGWVIHGTGFLLVRR